MDVRSQPRLRPVAGAVAGTPCPRTEVLWDGSALAVSDDASGQSVRVMPATLYHYRYEQRILGSGRKVKTLSVRGLAALDGDGLVLVDLPGEWHVPDVAAFVEYAGLPVVDARGEASKRVRAVLAGRAPGWRRFRGLPRPFLARYRGPVSIGVGVAGLAVMVYLASTGMWAAWRGISMIGRSLLDLMEAKWLAIGFSPVLLVLRPVSARVHRWRANRGLILGSAGGPYLSVLPDEKLQVHRGKEQTTPIEIGEGRRKAASLLLYRYDELAGLFILDGEGGPVHHLPGGWAPDAVHRFADRHKLPLAVHSISREEYLNLTRNARDATI
ncbi:hypothetical protein [Nonomuraea guangzhouensis]|uniref:DUF2207 domain-containing protein n=1 Tax=Nonomuraea guangzhouensis TaxID=1291555 RepID=A0ABW4GQ39_9ACTN|nr:hypothetical protein [Nonomuraea guangzhouensis]